MTFWLSQYMMMTIKKYAHISDSNCRLSILIIIKTKNVANILLFESDKISKSFDASTLRYWICLSNFDNQMIFLTVWVYFIYFVSQMNNATINYRLKNQLITSLSTLNTYLKMLRRVSWFSSQSTSKYSINEARSSMKVRRKSNVSLT